MAFSANDWAIVRAFFEQGLSLAEIVAREEVQRTGISDRGSISRKSKQEGWIKAKNATLATAEVAARKALDDVAEKKATLSATDREVHNTVVAERLASEKFFKSAHILNAQIVVKKLQTDKAGASYQDLNAAANALTKAQEGVLGKQPTVAIQNNNGGTTIDQSGAVVSARLPRAERMKAVRALLDSKL